MSFTNNLRSKNEKARIMFIEKIVGLYLLLDYTGLFKFKENRKKT